MFSIILYGRNDSHGYNLHKRAAISLNSMAEVMTDPDDEILFVDYNTPDDLPTFIEAIQDTLTAKARALTRVLRVRAEHHRRFASATHLVALEPIARNVAIRRSNPANRWILSTNTDMIFVPRSANRSLTEIIGDLDDGYYHLPRFELPECLWEAFDRLDGPGIINRARDWGRRFHLNEIVYSAGDNLYDAPGDFQLGLRSDYFDIHGFHEEMLIGWHVDANIARRMRLKTGSVRTLTDELVGYHCDHTRQATAVHKRDRVENDTTRFVENVTTPGIPSQAETWGLKSEKVEEIRLSNGVSARYIEALERSLPAGPEAFYEAWYTAESYNRLSYPAEHVLPYLVDLLSCAPAGSRVGFAGVRPVMCNYLKTAFSVLDPAGAFSVPASTDWLAADRAPVADWIEKNDIFVFEVGQGPDASIDEVERDGVRMSTVLNLFRQVSEAEEERQASRGLPPRRIIAVNAIHTYFEVVVSDAVAHTTTPFSTRTRHGYIASERLAASPAKTAPDLAQIGERLGYALKRVAPVPSSEVRRLIEIADSLPMVAEVSTPEWVVALQVAEPLIALMTDGRTASAISRSSDELDVLAQLLEQNRASSRPPPGLEVFTFRDGASEAATRLADVEDWERPAWLNWARRYFHGRKTYNYFDRRPWVWERVSVLDELDRVFGFSTVEADKRPRILVVSGSQEYLAACLLDAGADVDYLDPRYFLGEPNRADDWRNALKGGLMHLTRPVGSLAEDLEADSAEPYDAIVCTGNSVFSGGHGNTVDLLAALLPWLKPGGVFMATGIVQLAGEPHADRVGQGLVLKGRLATGIEPFTGLSPLRGVDDGLSKRTVDRSARSGQSSDAIEAFLHGDDETTIVGLWSWRGPDEPYFDGEGLSRFLSAADDDMVIPLVQDQFQQARRARPKPSVRQPAPAPAGASPPKPPISTQGRLPVSNGNQMTRISPAPFTASTPRGVHVPASSPEGRFASAAFGVAGSGAYELVVELRAGNVADRNATAVTVQLFSGDAVISETRISAGEIAAKARRTLEFEVPARPGHGPKPLELVLNHHGACDIDLLNLSIYSGARV